MINLGIIGCGRWGLNYVRVFNELHDSTVAMVCDQEQKALADIQTRYPSIETTTEFGEIIQSASVDALVIATPATTHFQLTKQALSSGKDVLVEKPMTTDVQQAEELVELAEKKSRILMVGHIFLFTPGIRRLKAVLSDTAFGEVYYLHSTRTNLGPIRQDVNAVWDLATHDVSIFDYLLGIKPVSVCAVSSKVLQTDKEDLAFITLKYPDNVTGHIHVSWVDPNKVRQVVAIGSRERVVFDDLNNLEKIRIFKKGVSVAHTDKVVDTYGEFQEYSIRDGDIISPKIEVGEALKIQSQHFLECINNKTRPFTDGTNGLDVVKVMSAIDKALDYSVCDVEV